MKRIAASSWFRTLVHGVTVASTAVAAYGGLVPPKYAAIVATVSAALSGFLHLVNTYAPQAQDPTPAK